MLRKTLCCSALLYVSLVSMECAQAASETPHDIGRVISPVNVDRPEAVIFSKKYSTLSLKKAYNLQKAFVKNSVAKGVDIVGYKAGLTSPQALKAMNLHEPVSGVLLVEPLAGPSAEIHLKNTQNVMLEMEVAYLISKPVNDKITAEKLSAYVASVAPAIEIPQLNFPSNDYNGFDIIANNTLAYKLMIGEWRAQWDFTSLDAISVTLGCNKSVVANGKGSNVFGSQEAALLWLINHIIDLGY